jgi:hypothetical protein
MFCMVLSYSQNVVPGMAVEKALLVVSCGSAGEPAEMFGQNGHRYS